MHTLRLPISYMSLQLLDAHSDVLKIYSHIGNALKSFRDANSVLAMPPLAVRHLQRFLPTTKWDRDSKTITIVDSPDNISKALKEAMFHDSHYQDVLEVYMELVS